MKYMDDHDDACLTAYLFVRQPLLPVSVAHPVKWQVLVQLVVGGLTVGTALVAAAATAV